MVRIVATGIAIDVNDAVRQMHALAGRDVGAQLLAHPDGGERMSDQGDRNVQRWELIPS